MLIIHEFALDTPWVNLDTLGCDSSSFFDRLHFKCLSVFILVANVQKENRTLKVWWGWTQSPCGLRLDSLVACFYLPTPTILSCTSAHHHYISSRYLMGKIKWNRLFYLKLRVASRQRDQLSPSLVYHLNWLLDII